MKQSTVFFLALITGLACNELQDRAATHEILNFIPGTYVRTFEGPFGVGRDTLIVAQAGTPGHYYTIQHKSTYQRIIESSLQPLEHKSEMWTAIFNEADEVLVEQKYGKLISFAPEEGELLLGNNKYFKIK